MLRHRVLRATIGLALVSGLLGQLALAESNPTLEGPNVQWRDTSEEKPLIDSVRQIVTGKRVGDLCIYQLRIDRGPNEPPKEMRPIAEDTVSCIVLTETGSFDPSEEVNSPDVATSSRAAEPARTISVSNGSIASSQSTARFLGQTKDPIYLTVNSVQLNLTWTWDGSTVNYVSGSDNLTWLTTTGWYVLDQDGPHSDYASSSDVMVYEDTWFANDFFCTAAGGGLESTYTVYGNPFAVHGTKSGGSYGTGSAASAGSDCASLLKSSYKLF